MSPIYDPWHAIHRCPRCGGQSLEDAGYDPVSGDRIEEITCRDCGTSVGGASYWCDNREEHR